MGSYICINSTSSEKYSYIIFPFNWLTHVLIPTPLHNIHIFNKESIIVHIKKEQTYAFSKQGNNMKRNNSKKV